MSRFLLPISRNWIGEEFYGSKYALHVASPHAVSPFLYVKCVLFACGATPACPRAAAYTNGFLQALRSGAVDGDLVQYIEHFDRATLGASPGLRRKDENELKIIRTMTPMQHRTMIYDAVKAAVFVRAHGDAPEPKAQVVQSDGAGDAASVPATTAADAANAALQQRVLAKRPATTAAGAVATGRDPVCHRDALASLQSMFRQAEIADIEVLSRELGLSPDVVIRAWEICKRERDLTLRKRAIFFS